MGLNPELMNPSLFSLSKKAKDAAAKPSSPASSSSSSSSSSSCLRALGRSITHRPYTLAHLRDDDGEDTGKGMGWHISTQIYQGGSSGMARVTLFGMADADDCDIVFGCHVAVTVFILHKEMLSALLQTPLDLFMGRDIHYHIHDASSGGDGESGDIGWW